MKNATKHLGALCAVILAACFITGCPDPAAEPVQKTDLKAALDAAAAAKAGVIVSEDGSDVFSTVFWVTTEQMGVFNAAISSARAVYDDGEATQAAVDTAETALLKATSAFSGQKKAGSKTGAAPSLTGIAISAPPTKTEYGIGDTLDLAGLIVTAAYSDDTTAVIGISELTTGGFDSSTDGSKTVTVTYNGKSAEFTVTVNPAGPAAFTSIAALGEWLSAQPANTAAAAYRAKLNVNALGGNAGALGSIGAVLLANPAKYVSLDLSGSTITTITAFAFNTEAPSYTGCATLTGITIPTSVTSIERYAFYRCAGLTSVAIPDSVTLLVGRAFDGCDNLTAINVDTQNTAYSSIDGILYNKNKTTLVKYPGGRTGAFAIPDSVVIIGENAFTYSKSLTGVTIPNSVTSIEDDAFRDCAGLTSVTIGNSVTTIGARVFNNCSSLTGITVDASNPNYSSVDGILYDKAKTRFINIPMGITGNVTIPNGVTSIGDRAFFGCTSLTGVTIPNSVTSIGDVAFSGCTSLTSVTIPVTLILRSSLLDTIKIPHL